MVLSDYIDFNGLYQKSLWFAPKSLWFSPKSSNPYAQKKHPKWSVRGRGGVLFKRGVLFSGIALIARTHEISVDTIYRIVWWVEVTGFKLVTGMSLCLLSSTDIFEFVSPCSGTNEGVSCIRNIISLWGARGSQLIVDVYDWQLHRDRIVMRGRGQCF